MQRVPPFTHEVQAWIWQRQNPPPSQCSSASYLLGFVAADQGLGSAMHTATIHLAVAMQHNRIFLWAPDTSETPIAEERMWWRETVDAKHQFQNNNVRCALPYRLAWQIVASAPVTLQLLIAVARVHSARLA